MTNEELRKRAVSEFVDHWNSDGTPSAFEAALGVILDELRPEPVAPKYTPAVMDLIRAAKKFATRPCSDSCQHFTCVLARAIDAVDAEASK